jgi:DNA-binding NarL/FixJ family response regulator
MLILEDEVLMQRLLGAELEALGFDVVFARSVVEAKKQLERHDPDIALIDIGLQGALSGLHFGHYLAIKHPDVAQVFLSSVDLGSSVHSDGLGIPAGAGFVSKNAVGDGECLLEVINDVVAGKGKKLSDVPVSIGALDALGKKGRRVMELVAGGYSNHYIAQQLGVTQKTVEYYVDQGYKALGVAKSDHRNARVDAALRYQQLVHWGSENSASG